MVVLTGKDSVFCSNQTTFATLFKKDRIKECMKKEGGKHLLSSLIVDYWIPILLEEMDFVQDIMEIDTLGFGNDLAG